MRLGVILLISIICFVGCKKDTSRQKKYLFSVSFSMIYEESTGITRATAKFYVYEEVNSSKQAIGSQLPGKCEILFNNSELTFDNGSQLYVKDYSGIVPEGTFRFKDEKDNWFTNTIPIPEPINHVSHDTLLFDKSYFDYFWSGKPLQKEKESINVNITYPELDITPGRQPQAGTAASTTVTGADHVTLYAPFAVNKTNTVGVYRIIWRDLTQPTNFGGYIRSQYIAKSRKIFIMSSGK